MIVWGKGAVLRPQARQLLALVFLASAVLVPDVARAHGGGTDARGGHHCRQAGYNSGKCAPLNSYHCHSAACEASLGRETPTPAPTTTDAPTLAPSVSSTALSDLNALRLAAEEDVGYDRELFEHWIDEDGDGCDTRVEVLQQETRTAISDGGCSLAGGSWLSEYDGETWSDPSDVDIDHMVPLKEAWGSGANGWDGTRRREFANDLGFDGSLIAVTDNVNQSKSDRDPAEWLPPRAEYHCTYATTWVAVKKRWDLAVDTAEKDKLASMLSVCVGAATSAGGTPTDAASTLNTQATGTPSKSDVVPGDRVGIAGDGFQPSSMATATFRSDPIALGSVEVDTTGRFSVTATVPESAAVGSHHIVVEGPNSSGGVHTLTFVVNVAAAALPATGSFAAIVALVGFTLLVVGANLLLIARRNVFLRRVSLRRGSTQIRRLGV